MGSSIPLSMIRRCSPHPLLLPVFNAVYVECECAGMTAVHSQARDQGVLNKAFNDDIFFLGKLSCKL